MSLIYIKLRLNSKHLLLTDYDFRVNDEYKWAMNCHCLLFEM